MNILISATYCGSCKIAKEMYDNNGINYIQYESDSEEGEDFIDEYNLKRIPAMINIESGRVIVGEPSNDDIEFLKDNNNDNT